MYKYFTSFIALFLTITSFAQNIVVNPSFEQISQCPWGPNELNKATGWERPTGGTADVFNVCAPNVGVPSNWFGSQSPDTGVAYAGMIPFGMPNYVEYVQGHLTNMQVGQFYRVSMKVSLAETSSAGSSGLGILFSVDSIGTHYTFSDMLPVTPQVDYSHYGPISDMLKWITLTDTLYADSAYQFLTIGRFQAFDLVETDSLFPGNPGSYYYIDDVTVEPIAVSVASYSVNEVSIYPNPISDASTINFKNPERDPYTFCLYNLQGQLIRKISDVCSGQFLIRREGLPTGLYTYRLSSDRSGGRFVGKLQVD